MKPIHILLVEDNEGDILLIKEAFEEAKIVNQITTVKDGEKAIYYLQQKGEYENMDRPDLIILDMNLPRKSGREVLSLIKNDSALLQIPVIMLTTSASEQDILESYQYHANCYITKPVEMDNFMNAIRQIEKFWIQLVKLSPGQ